MSIKNLIKNAEYAIRIAYTSLNGEKKAKLNLYAYWIIFFSYSFSQMLQPVINEKILNGATSIINNNKNMFDLLFAVSGIILTAVISYIYIAYQYSTAATASNVIENKIKRKIYDKLCKIKYSYFNSNKLYDDITIINENIPSCISNYITNTNIIAIIGALITLIFTTYNLVRVNVIIAIIIILSNIYEMFSKLHETKVSYNIAVNQVPERRWSNTYSNITTNRSFIKEIRFFKLSDYLFKKWENIGKKLSKQNIILIIKFTISDLIKFLISNIFIILALAMTVYMIVNGETQIGSFILVYGSASVITSGSSSLYQAFVQLRESSNYIDRWHQLLNLEEIEIDVEMNLGITEKIDVKFENVSFKYDGNEQNAIDGISLNIRQGEHIAIVGGNGSGKTTFVHLLNGLYQPNEGKILINDKDIKDQLHMLRKHTITLFQDFTTYEFTIKDNIRMGDMYREVTDNEIETAAKYAGADKFINDLNKKYDTPIGTLDDNGINLSAGQWQKIVLARTLLRKDSKIFVMDEPTSALDPISEARLYEEVQGLTSDRTTIMVSHRLGATSFMDRILVFDKGKIVEDGSHEELMNMKGMYYKMYTAQAKWYK